LLYVRRVTKQLANCISRSLCNWRWTSRRLWFRGKDSSAAHFSHACFLPQYRLASNPGGRFPAQLQDAVTSLLYLTMRCKFRQEDHYLRRQCRGNLCLALLRYIADNPRQRCLPRLHISMVALVESSLSSLLFLLQIFRMTNLANQASRRDLSR